MISGPSSSGAAVNRIRSIYAPFATLLDSLNVAICIFDLDDGAALWNNTFLRFFPEHAGHVELGEHYRENLKRFYEFRLHEGELQFIDEYIERSLARHRSDHPPYVFKHRERWVRVAAQGLEGLGKIRAWTEVSMPQQQNRNFFLPAGAPLDIAHMMSMASMPDPIVVLDLNNVIVSCNDLFARLYEVPPDHDILGITLEKLVQDLWQRYPEEEGGEHFDTTIRPLLSDDMRLAGVAFELPLPRNRWVRVVEQRNREGFRTCVHFDITRYKRERQDLQRAESEARAQEARFRAVIERSPIGMSIASDDGTILEANDAYGQFLGYSPEELIGMKLWELMHPEEQEPARAVLAELVAGHVSSLERESRFMHRDGSLRWARQSAVHLAGSAVNGEIISQIQDVTARRQAENERDALLADLAHRAAHDGLTGLPNRAAFEECLRSAMRTAKLSHKAHALCFLDLDGFKRVNDAAGHVAGDQVLRMVAGILKQHTRPADFLARLGGDEFGLIIHDCDLETTMACASSLIEAISTASFTWDGRSFSLGLSVGITKVSDQVPSIDELLRRADEACYRAKRAGRNLAVLA